MTVEVRVAVDVSTARVGVEISAVGGAAVSISIWKVQPEIKKTIVMRSADVFFITNPS
jgi:hypothetical protein